MGKYNERVGFMKKRLKILELFYLGIWIIPFILFGKDFFVFSDFFSLFDTDLVKVLIFTFKQSFYSTVLAFLFGIFPAIYIANKKGIIKKLIETSIFIPFFFPVVSTIISFTIISNLKFIKDLNILYSFNGIILANIFYNTPIFVKYISEGLKKISPNLIENAELDGANALQIFLMIKLPIIWPSILRAGFLVFSYCFTSFGVILGIGGIKYSTIEVEIATTLFSSFNFSKAFALGILQFLFLLIVNFTSHKVENYELTGEFQAKKEKIGFFTRIVSLIYLSFEYIFVLTALVFGFVDKSTGKLTFKYFTKLFTKEFNEKYPILEAFFNSAGIAIVTAFLTIVFVYFFLKKFNKFTNYVVLSSLGVSSAFLGICLIYMNILYSIPLYLILVLGYFMITVPIAYSYLYYPILSFDKSLIESAKLDGATNFTLFKKIEFPLLKNIFIAVFIQIFAVIFAEFTISYTMQIKDFIPTMATINYDMSSHRYFAESTALSALNTIIIVVLFVISTFIFTKKSDKNESL